MPNDLEEKVKKLFRMQSEIEAELHEIQRAWNTTSWLITEGIKQHYEKIEIIYHAI